MSKDYFRKFITLSQDGGQKQKAFGTLVAEQRDGVNKVTLSVSNVNSNAKYILEFGKVYENEAKFVEILKFSSDNFGNCTTKSEIKNTLLCGIEISNFDVCIVKVASSNDVITPLVGYFDQKVKWREFYKKADATYKKPIETKSQSEVKKATQNIISNDNPPLNTSGYEFGFSRTKKPAKSSVYAQDDDFVKEVPSKYKLNETLARHQSNNYQNLNVNSKVQGVHHDNGNHHNSTTHAPTTTHDTHHDHHHHSTTHVPTTTHDTHHDHHHHSTTHVPTTTHDTHHDHHHHSTTHVPTTTHDTHHHSTTHVPTTTHDTHHHSTTHVPTTTHDTHHHSTTHVPTTTHDTHHHSTTHVPTTTHDTHHHSTTHVPTTTHDTHHHDIGNTHMQNNYTAPSEVMGVSDINNAPQMYAKKLSIQDVKRNLQNSSTDYSYAPTRNKEILKNLDTNKAQSIYETRNKIPHRIEDIFNYSTKVTPFTNRGKDISWVNIDYTELVMIDSKQKFIKNPFFRNSYKNFSHLILGSCIESNRVVYLLGIPDYYDSAYEDDIRKMGFISFKASKDNENDEKKGYWIIVL